MNPDKSLQNLFCDALERADPVERARFLDDACGADAALRERVEKLLRAREEFGAFMSQPSRKPAGLDLNSTGRVVIPLTEKPGTGLVVTNFSSKSVKAAVVSSTWPSMRPRLAGRRTPGTKRWQCQPVVRFVPEGAVQRLDLPNPGYCPNLN